MSARSFSCRTNMVRDLAVLTCFSFGLFDRLSVGVKKCRKDESMEQLSAVIVDGCQPLLTVSYPFCMISMCRVNGIVGS